MASNPLHQILGAHLLHPDVLPAQVVARGGSLGSPSSRVLASEDQGWTQLLFSAFELPRFKFEEWT